MSPEWTMRKMRDKVSGIMNDIFLKMTSPENFRALYTLKKRGVDKNYFKPEDFMGLSGLDNLDAIYSSQTFELIDKDYELTDQGEKIVDGLIRLISSPNEGLSEIYITLSKKLSTIKNEIDENFLKIRK